MALFSPHEMPIAIMMVRSPHHRTAASQGWGRQRSLWVPLSRPSQGPGPPESASPPGTTSIGCWRSQSPTVISLHSHTWIAYKYIYIYIYIYIILYTYNCACICIYIYLSLSHSLVIYIYVCMYVCICMYACMYLPTPVLNLCLQDLQIDVLIILVLPPTTDVSTL